MLIDQCQYNKIMINLSISVILIIDTIKIIQL